MLVAEDEPRKSDYQEKERVQVKLEFLRMLPRMELDPARMTLPDFLKLTSD